MHNVIKTTMAKKASEVTLYDYSDKEFEYEPRHSRSVENLKKLEPDYSPFDEKFEYVNKGVEEVEDVEYNEKDDDDDSFETDEEIGRDKLEARSALTEAEAIVIDAKEKAKAEAEDIIAKAYNQVEYIKQQAYEKGYSEGLQKGLVEALEEHKADLNEKSKGLLANLKTDIEAIEHARDNIIKEEIDDLRDLAIAIAEKVINVSLKSSGEIVKKMIMAATEKSKNVVWAKLYISQVDWELSLKSDVRIINTLKRITDTVNVEILDSSEQGTCIIEFPDQIIDASVKTQLGQVKRLLEDADR